MTIKQIVLLTHLNSALLSIAEECENDINFNEEIASLNIFQRSIGDVCNDIFSKIEK